MLNEKMEEKVENFKAKIKENRNKIIGGIALAGAAVGAVVLGIIALNGKSDIIDIDYDDDTEIEDYDDLDDENDSDDEDEDEDDED